MFLLTLAEDFYKFAAEWLAATVHTARCNVLRVDQGRVRPLLLLETRLGPVNNAFHAPATVNVAAAGKENAL